ncbi:MAG: prepilin peptidase [Candidatus Paceibacteria bacterium]
METLLTASFFILGLLVGSFLNVIALRFGFHEAKRSRSACQACQTTLVWYELIPLVSYLALSGRCRTCGSGLSLQYPLVELVTGILFALSFLSALPVVGAPHVFGLLFLLVFWASFVVLVTYDLKHTLVPRAFAVSLVVSAFLVRAGEAWALDTPLPLYDAALGAVALALSILAIVLITRGRGMGLGDVYVVGALGALFGLARGMDVLLLAFWLGAVVGIALLAAQKRVTMKSEVPFVPFMFVAALLGAFTGLSAFGLVNVLVSLWFPY